MDNYSKGGEDVKKCSQRGEFEGGGRATEGGEHQRVSLSSAKEVTEQQVMGRRSWGVRSLKLPGG